MLIYHVRFEVHAFMIIYVDYYRLGCDAVESGKSSSIFLGTNAIFHPFITFLRNVGIFLTECKASRYGEL